MNDVTEFESSLAGTIDFFQNLRRKMGVLEAETGAQHDLLRTVATSVATLQQDQETDQRSLATLAGDLAAQTAQLAKLQSDSRLLDEQLTQVETLVACLQQDGQDLRQTLATLIGDLRTQGAALRQELESALEQRTTPVARLLALEEQLADQSQQLHGLLAFLKAQGQDAGQTRQELQQQQERQKHLETLLGKLSADTNSTRQILNVLQTDLTTQSDTLRELDQTWQDGLATYQYRLSHLETAIADSGLPPAATRPEPLSLAALSVETAASPPALLPIEWERLDELAATVASAREEQQEQRRDLAAVQTTLATQYEYLNNQGDILAEQLQTQQQRLGELETTLDTLRQGISSRDRDRSAAPARGPGDSGGDTGRTPALDTATTAHPATTSRRT
ncbi:MAG: hypothetical protein MZV65_30625 [Chromatiales bacterium]|nr:hypothetical protein [Chromatiales bacterium]